jgi:hypothetical protein
MLKRMLASTAVLALLALIPLTLAAQAHKQTAGTEMTITGQVVDLNCSSPPHLARATRRAPTRAPSRVSHWESCRATARSTCR